MLAKTDPTRLTVALAESLTLRAFIKPITFGGKLWVTYEFMKFVKRKRATRASSAKVELLDPDEKAETGQYGAFN